MKPNKFEKGRGNARYRLKPDEVDILREYRRVKEEAEFQGVNPNDVHSGWIKSKESSLYFKNSAFRTNDLKEFRLDLLKDLKEYAPEFEKIKKPKVHDGHCLLISPADIHIGKLCKSFVTGEEYNKQVAVLRTLEGVNGCLEKSKGFNIDKIILIIGNDAMHIDTATGGKTTSGVYN